MIRVFPCVSGLSLDHQTVSAVSRVRLSEREEESLSCYLRACDAALSYLQELDKVDFWFMWSLYDMWVCFYDCVCFCSLTDIENRNVCVCVSAWIKYSLLSVEIVCVHQLHSFPALFIYKQTFEEILTLYICLLQGCFYIFSFQISAKYGFTQIFSYNCKCLKVSILGYFIFYFIYSTAIAAVFSSD